MQWVPSLHALRRRGFGLSLAICYALIINLWGAALASQATADPLSAANMPLCLSGTPDKGIDQDQPSPTHDQPCANCAIGCPMNGCQAPAAWLGAAPIVRSPWSLLAAAKQPWRSESHPGQLAVLTDSPAQAPPAEI